MEVEKSRKVLQFKKELKRNKLTGGEEGENSTAAILKKYFSHRIDDKKFPLPVNLINFLETRNEILKKRA